MCKLTKYFLKYSNTKLESKINFVWGRVCTSPKFFPRQWHTSTSWTQVGGSLRGRWSDGIRLGKKKIISNIQEYFKVWQLLESFWPYVIDGSDISPSFPTNNPSIWWSDDPKRKNTSSHQHLAFQDHFNAPPTLLDKDNK